MVDTPNSLPVFVDSGQDPRLAKFLEGSRELTLRRGRKYPKDLVDLAVSYARDMLKLNKTNSHISKVLKISQLTLKSWLNSEDENNNEYNFDILPVKIIDQNNKCLEISSGLISVKTPNGFVVSGLTVDSAISLLRSLS